MFIPIKQIIELQQSLSCSAPTAPQAGTEREHFHVGAVWHGNWLENADRGRFGSPEKRKHNACISQRNQPATFFMLAPITSQEKQTEDVVVLPAGTIPGGELCTSYVLFRWRLAARRKTLEDAFTYKATLPPQYIQEIRTRMKEYEAR